MASMERKVLVVILSQLNVLIGGGISQVGVELTRLYGLSRAGLIMLGVRMER